MATALYAAMLEQIISTITSGSLCNVKLVCAPDSQHSIFHDLQKNYKIELGTQQGSDLGERMFQAASASLLTYKSVVLLGTDCLQMTEYEIGQSLAQLQNRSIDALITPAYDGGYVLLGLNRIDQQLFSGIDWGTERVFEQTENILQQMNWCWKQNPKLHDIDTIDDLKDVYKNEHQYRLNTGVRGLLQSIFD